MNKLVLSLLIFSSTFLFSQVTDDLIREVLKDELQTSQTQDETGYVSFTQNELKNTITQLREVDDQIERDLFRTKLVQDRIELASKLCAKDPRACFLIDKYQDYKWSEDLNNQEPELFGLDIFSGYPMSFDATDESSLGSDYTLRIGDKLRIFVTGIRNIDTEIQIRNSGEIVIPSFGPLSIAGLTLDSANEIAQEFVKSKDLGSTIYISLNQIKTNQTFVLGVVQNPGAYLLNSLSGPINGIISSGGFNKNASLRNIEIFREGQRVAGLDLYDLLIFGDSQNDRLLESGDVILVGSAENTVTVKGEVLRPAIYEIKEGDNLQDLLKFSLGLTLMANKENLSIRRLDSNGNYSLINVNSSSNIPLMKGDVIEVHKREGVYEGVIIVHGEIKSKGEYVFKNGLMLGDIIKSESHSLDKTYLPYALIKRYNKVTRGWSYLSFNLYNQADLDSLPFQDRDEVFILSKSEIDFINSSFLRNFYREKDLLKNFPDINKVGDDQSYSAERLDNSCLNYFNKQNNNVIAEAIQKKLSIFGSDTTGSCTDLLNEYPEISPLIFAASIPVLGNVLNPGLYPIAPGVDRNQLLAAAGGIITTAGQIELEVGVDQRFQKTLLTFLNAKLTDIIQEQGYITLSGEFRKPGIYPFKKGETVLNLIKRAGGLSDTAYPLGAIFTRESLKTEEQNMINRATNEISEVLSNAVASGYLQQSSTDLVSLVELMSSLKATKPVGRMIVELNPVVLERNSHLDIPVQSGDEIYMPRLSNIVNVSGQVMNPVFITYENSNNFMDYINSAGGVRDGGDLSNAFAILPNGKTVNLRKGFLGISYRFSEDILPGTTIYIPRKQRPLDSLALVETISPIIASLSVTAASIAAISNNN